MTDGRKRAEEMRRKREARKKKELEELIKRKNHLEVFLDLR